MQFVVWVQLSVAQLHILIMFQQKPLRDYNVSLNHNIPVSFGVLTTDTIEQAIERAGSKAGNKGFEAMTTVIEMLNLSKEL